MTLMLISSPMSSMVARDSVFYYIAERFIMIGLVEICWIQ